jgi:lipopolysaccharide/colanic/teichoic acid biosynthesis glycosyltransferase
MRIPSSKGPGVSKDNRIRDYLKRAFDVIAASVLLLVLTPLVFLPVAIIIAIESRGPVIFGQERYGVGRRIFRMYKFRTMVGNADEILDRNPELRRELELNYKIANDPRVTRFGRILRNTAIDELPQLWNVLKGEMSIVGPRPIPVYPCELHRYGDRQDDLLSAKPGITGLWQVSGKNSLPYEERVRLDLYYVAHHNLWMDLKIIRRTWPAVAGQTCDVPPFVSRSHVIVVRTTEEREREEALTKGEITAGG